MRLAGGILALVLGAVVVSASAVPGMLTLVPVVHVPGFAPADPLQLALASVGAESWVERALPFARLMNPTLASVAFEETRSLGELVGFVYAHVGLPYDAGARRMVEAQVAALPSAVGWGLQQLLGAIEVGMMDWRLATASLTEEDWAELAAAEDAEGPTPPALDKLDAQRIRVSALRLVGVVDAVVPVLQEAALDAGPSSGEFLFRDPFDLILVGGTGTNAYYGNSAPPGLFLRSTHILVVDLGGEDYYYSELGMAFARDWGIPVSVAVDLGGNDRYTPVPGRMGVAVQGGVSLLVDAGGDDFYWNYDFVEAGSSAVALFLESSGDDSYQSGWTTQSYAIHRGLALLFDRFGSDVYRVFFASQAYASVDGLAVLVDGAGSDFFLAEGFSNPGSGVQGVGFGGLGVFLNIGAQDVYSAGFGSQGWTEPGSYGGIFLDTCGNDTYLANSVGRDGATWEQNRFGLGFDVNLPTMPCFVAE